MELNFSLGRLVLFVVLVGGFAVLGGFSQPDIPEQFSSIRSHEVWSYCGLMFVVGAVCASLIDHPVGNLNRGSLRILYVLLGVGLMVAGAWWLHSIKRVGSEGWAPIPRFGGISPGLRVPYREQHGNRKDAFRAARLAYRLSSSIRLTDRSAFARTSSGMRISGSR